MENYLQTSNIKQTHFMHSTFTVPFSKYSINLNAAKNL